MYGKWLFKEIQTEYGYCKVEIFRKGYSGSQIEIGALAANSLTITLENLGSITDPIGKSVCSFEIIDTDQISYDDFFTPDATAYKVVVSTKEGSSTFVTRWSGYITPDFFAENLTYRTPISISARDNIGYLNDVDFDMVATTTTVRNLITSAFARIASDYPMNVVFATEKQTAEGVLAIDATISTALLVEGSWYEALEVVLHDLGLQMRWVDNNTIAVMDLSQIPEYYAIQSFNFIHASGYREILPAWRELSQSQDFGLRENFFDGWLNENNIAYVKTEAYSTPEENYAEVRYYVPQNWGVARNIYTTNPQDYKAEFGNKIYFSAVSEDNPSTTYMSWQVNVQASSIPLTIKCNALNTVVYPYKGGLRKYNPFLIGGARGLGDFLQIGIKANLFLHTGSTTYVMRNDWEVDNGTGSGAFINYTLDKVSLDSYTQIEGKGSFPNGVQPSEKEITLVANTIPYDGVLEFRIYGYYIVDYKFKMEETGWNPHFDKFFTVIDNLTFTFNNGDAQTGVDTNVSVGDVHNVKSAESYVFGQIPANAGGINAYAGGLYNAADSMSELIGFQRNSSGSNYNLLELVGREIIHFNKKNYNKLSGIIKNLDKEPLMFNKLFVREGKTYAPFAYSLNVISNEMEVTTMQEVEPYTTESFTQIVSALTTGGATVGGGNNTVMQYSEEAGNAKRVFELDQATEEEKKDAYLLIDNNTFPQARKIHISQVNNFWDSINVGTEEEPVWALMPKDKDGKAVGIVTKSFITFGGTKKGEGEEGGGSAGITTFDVFVGNNGPYSLQDGKVNLPAYPVVPNALPNPHTLTINGTPYDGSAPVDIKVKAGVDDAQLADYAKRDWVEDNFTPVDAHNTLSQRVTALENSGTGGGSGGTTSVVSYNPSVLSGKLLGTLTINGIDNKIYAPAIPTKLSAFTNDEGYATEGWVNDQGFLTAHQSLTHLLSKIEAADTYQPKGDYAVLDDLSSYLLASTAKNTYATIQALNAATLRIDTLEVTLSTEQGYIDTLQGYFTSGKAKKAIADGNGNNIVDTYATKAELKDVADKVATLQDMWFFDEAHANTIRTLYNVVVDKAISFGGYGESSGSGGGLTQVTVKLGDTSYVSDGGVVSLPAYPTVPKVLSAFTNDIGYITSSALTNYLTTNTPQTILASGAKIFKGAYGENIYIGGTKSGITIDANAANGGFARTIAFINSASAISGYVLFGVQGNSVSGFQNAYISVGEQDYYNAILNIYTDRIDVAGAASFSDLTTHSAGLKIGTTNVIEKTQNSTKYIEIDGNLVVTGAISFGGFGEGGSTGGGITTVTKDMVISALGFTPYNAANFTKANIKFTLGIYDWALASTKPSYTKSDVGLGDVTNLAASGYLTDLSSNTTNAVSITVGGTTKNISVSTLKTTLGLGSLAYKSSLLAGDIPSLPWSKITSGKPTTLSGYGITDALSSSTKYALGDTVGGNAIAANKLSDNASYTAWGQVFFKNGKPSNISGDLLLSDTTGSASKSYKLKFIRRTSTDDYWDFGLYAQSTKGLTFYNSSDGVDTDIAYLTGEGNFVVNGSITFGSASDRRLKDNIKSMTDKQAVAVLSALNPVTFNWNSTAYELGKLSGVSDGFIADEYEKLIPNSGRDIWVNYRAINYERATGYLVKGWQNHETRLEKAERRIKELENELKQYRRA